MTHLAIGVDLGGTQARAALIDEAGVIYARASVTTAADAGPSVVTGQLRDLAAEVSAGVARDRLIGVGVCSPGPIDTLRGVALDIPTLAGFAEAPFRHMIEQAVGLPAWLENDGIAAALGEWRFGAGRGRQNLVFITVSTGIGGGVVLDGRELHGRKGLAGHIGHMTIVRDGEACLCGNRGCWEAYASGPAFARRARLRAESDAETRLGKDGAAIDPRAIFAAAADGDGLAQALVADEADLLGLGIANLLHLFSPDVVILGGGVANGFDQLRPGIIARIQASAMPAFRDTPIVRSALGDNSGLIGAAALVFDSLGLGAEGTARG